MAKVITVNGLEFNFDEQSVSAVADHDAATGNFVTCLYGFPAGLVMTTERVVPLLTRLNISDHFAKLTRPNDDPVWIRGSAVLNLSAPIPGEYDPNVRSIVSVLYLTQAVTEDLVTSKELINACGGNI